LALAISAVQSASLDWVKLAEAQGVPATRATTAEEFHQQFGAAMSTKGPRLIEAQIVQNLKPAVDAVHSSRG
jgi:acetolactate synthase-1/2/3 large subunit